jgi:hypothetical protein
MTYQRLTGTLNQILRSLGLSRRSKDMTPDPLEYARQHSEAAE